MQMPKELEELRSLVSTTLPFIDIEECEIENMKTKQRFPSLALTFKDDQGEVGLVHMVSLAIENDNLLISIHVHGQTKPTMMSKPMRETGVSDMLSMLHAALVDPDDVS